VKADTQQPTLWKRERLLILGWQTLGDRLADLERQVRESGFEPSVILGMRRGSFVPAVFLSHALGIRECWPMFITRNSSDSHYSERRPAEVDFAGMSYRFDSQRILIVDDITGDGGTLELAVRLVADAKPEDVRTAVIVKNAALENATAGKLIRALILLGFRTTVEDNTHGGIPQSPSRFLEPCEVVSSGQIDSETNREAYAY
jgi:hypoxanthine phosphoribosyltransferase